LTPNSPAQVTSLVLRSTYSTYLTADYPNQQSYDQWNYDNNGGPPPTTSTTTSTEGTVVAITLWDSYGHEYSQGDVEYVITGTGITAADFTPAVLTGTFLAANWVSDGGIGYTNTNMLMIANDAIVEGEETFTVTIVTTGTTGWAATGGNYLRVNIADGTTEGSESGHIHLISENMAQTSIFLGNDDKYVKVAADDQIYINVPNADTSATSQLWTFAGDGKLTLPAGGDIVDSTGASVLGVGTSSFVLVVDQSGNNSTANGSITKPFATIQSAHDYASNNFTSTDQVVIQVNPGMYTENLTLTRALTHIVGLTTGASKSTRIIGSITVNLITPILGGTSNDIFSIENLVVSQNAVTLSGDQSYMFLAKNILFTTSESTGNNLKSTNTSTNGIKIELTDCLFENQNSSDVSIDLSNVWYGNFSQLSCYSGSNSVMKISNSNVIMFNSRLTTSTGTNVIEAVSGFGGGVSLIGGSLVIINSQANGNGVNISSGATVNIANSAFQVGTSAGTGRAVYGVSGSIFVNGTNTIIYGTNAKRSTAITNVPHVTSFTAS